MDIRRTEKWPIIRQTDIWTDRYTYIYQCVCVIERMKEGDLSKLYSFEFSMLDHNREDKQERNRERQRDNAYARENGPMEDRDREKERETDLKESPW